MWIALIVSLTFVLSNFTEGWTMFGYIYWMKPNEGDAKFSLIKYEEDEEKMQNEQSLAPEKSNVEKSDKELKEKEDDSYLVAVGMTKI